ncbi:hypothetical protein CUN19_00695, partial [Enterococcus faecium]|uniref:hypothetical protein n=1 Tax=Enterococcus faecium TaxID=1352 RepID=UPI000CF1DA24
MFLIEQKEDCDKNLHSPFSGINGVLLPTPRSQVKIFIKHEKLFLFGCSYYLMQNSFFTTSPLNIVQSADPRYSLKKQQNMRNY